MSLRIDINEDRKQALLMVIENYMKMKDSDFDAIEITRIDLKILLTFAGLFSPINEKENDGFSGVNQFLNEMMRRAWPQFDFYASKNQVERDANLDK